MDNNTGPAGITEIPLSKVKTILALIGAIAFVAAGILLINHPEMFHKDRTLIKGAGYVSAIFFGICVLFIVNKIFDPRAGFTIDSDGLFDNTSMFSIGFIPWADVTDIKIVNISGQRLIAVKVEDVEGYIRRQPNVMARRAAAANNRLYGTPALFGANSLKISFDELYDTILQRWRESQNPNFSSFSANSQSPLGNDDAPAAGL